MVGKLQNKYISSENSKLKCYFCLFLFVIKIEIIIEEFTLHEKNEGKIK